MAGDVAGLEAAYQAGYKHMLYIYDSRPRVIAKRGKKEWLPRDYSRPFSGPAWAAEWIKRRGY